MMRRLAVAVVVPLLLVAGCGEETADPTASEASGTASEAASPSEDASSDPAPTEPTCAEIWVDDQKLPGAYRGCYEGEELIKPDGRYCEFGKKLFTHDDRFYAVKGGTIHEAQEPFRTDPGYQDTLAKCSG